MISFNKDSKTFIIDTEEEALYICNALNNITEMMREYFEDMPYVDYDACFEIEYRDENEE